LQDALTLQPDQEQKLISKEEEEKREKILLVALSKLTEHERKLFFLMRQGLKPSEIAKEMGIKKESAYTEISILKGKLQKIIKEEMKSGNEAAKDV
jgi:DNA-directed RNA polymerase specialized sigma24 family protein